MNTDCIFQTRRCRAQRGAALPTALALLLFMGIFGAGLLSLVSGSLKLAQRGDDTAEALNMADGGLDLAMSWFSQQGTPPDGAAVQFPAGNQFFGTNGVIPHPFSAAADSSSLTVRITWDITNVGSVQKRYVVDSTAKTASGATATVRAFVQQSSFGKYAVFLDSTPPGAYWASGLNVFDGPVHSNNSDNGNPPAANGALNNVVWGDGSGATPRPVFTYRGNDAFTVSGPSINWMRNSYGNLSAPTSEAEWRMIATGGSGSVQTGVPMIAMPSSSASRQYAALGQPVPPPPGDTIAPGGLPNTFGVTVPHNGGNGPTTGGLYIQGPVQQMNLSVDPGNSTTQIIQVKQTDANLNPYTTTVTLNASNNSTSVHVDYMKPNGGGTFIAATTDNAYPGVTNGVVYCAGNIGKTDPLTQIGNDPNTQTLVNPRSGGVTGVVADGRALTLATDTGHDVNINGSLTYKTPRQTDAGGNLLPESDPANAAFRANAGTLGIVSKKVEVVENDAAGNPITNIEVDAAVMAFDTYDATNYRFRPVGKMLNMGTYIVKNRGLFSQGSGLNVTGGIPCSRLYDNRLADRPPPFFPTTSSHYDVVSWQRVVTPLP
jgi:Tfp pilus assembly protein PilX